MLHYLETPPAAEDLLGQGLKRPVYGGIVEFTEGLKEITKAIASFDNEMSKVVKTMGIGAQEGLLIKQNFNDSYAAIVKMGGTFADVVDQQEALLKASGRNLISIKEQSQELLAATSVTGLKAEVLQESFYNAGMEGAHIAENMLKVVEISNKMGVNAQAVSSVVTTNLDKLNRLGFTNGVEGLAKMAGKAQALRFDVAETFNLAESLMSPEKAIETAAAIQRLGGTATALTDPLKLMDFAQNNVEGLQDELAKLAKQYTFFNEKTQSFEIMKGAKGQLREVAAALDIDRTAFEKLALSSASLSKKMSEIRFNLDMSEEDKEKLANLAQLKDIGGGRKEYVINYKDASGNLVTEEISKIGTAQLDLIKKQTESQSTETDPQQKLIDISNSQLTETHKLVIEQERLSNTLVNTLAGSKMGERLTQDVTKDYKKAADSITTAFGKGSDFDRSMNDANTNVVTFSTTVKNLLSGNINQVFKSFESAGTILGAAGSTLVTEFLGTLKREIPLAVTAQEMFVRATSVLFGGKDLNTMMTAAGGDVYREPRIGGDTLKTPSGDIVLHDKDYFLAATQLPDVLQKSVNKGLMDVLKIERQSMDAVMMTTNTQTQQQSQPQKQEVVHTVNFKVSVDTPRNKLSDMLVEELPKNKTLMEYIVKHFENTKTSGGITSRK
jgi:hypothetical protein